MEPGAATPPGACRQLAYVAQFGRRADSWVCVTTLSDAQPLDLAYGLRHLERRLRIRLDPSIPLALQAIVDRAEHRLAVASD